MAQDHNHEVQHDFTPKVPQTHLDRLREAHASGVKGYVEISQVYLGVAASLKDNSHLDVGFCNHDGQYSTDFAIFTIAIDSDAAAALIKFVIPRVRQYAEERNYKIVGAGITNETVHLSPDLPMKMWQELDLVPLVFGDVLDGPFKIDHPRTVDELAESMARRCVLYFGPNGQPQVQIGFRNSVDVDVGGHALLCSVQNYQQSVGKTTWKATMHFAERLRKRNTRIAFFNATPQGGGVALMRHALVRLLRLLGIDIRWYVPMPRPEVFRITKTNHNILQGVAGPEETLTDDQINILKDWSGTNANRFWLPEQGPLSAPSNGGAHFIVVDDPQLPYLVPIAKNADPNRPVVFRSHIQIRGDLVDRGDNNPTQQVFEWLYDLVKEADLFISHPVSNFVPKVVKPETVAYLPATTDWLDGLNKELPASDSRFYLHEYNLECSKKGQPTLAFPKRDYIVQIARFDPSKGIPDVLASYAKLRRRHLSSTPPSQTPQLVIAGHGAIDDPDFSRIMEQTAELLLKDYSDIMSDISVMRLGSTDQMLNALMSNAKIALQLSTREGFEVKVSEALHKGVPVIATRTGGIPLQVDEGKSGFLVDPGNSDQVAEYMAKLLSDNALYERMSKYAASHVSDEVGTVGNALSWLYLADTMTEGKETLKTNGRWINDLARQKAGVPYQEGETRLDRHLST